MTHLILLMFSVAYCDKIAFVPFTKYYAIKQTCYCYNAAAVIIFDLV